MFATIMVALPPEIIVKRPPPKIIPQKEDTEKVQTTRPAMNRFFAVPEISLDRESSHSLRQQLILQIVSAVSRGELPNGTRLPSSRILAKLLNISRNTVVEAYEQLLEAGFIAVQPRRGVTVNHAASSAIPNFAHLRRTARAAHFPLRTFSFQDADGTLLYLNLSGGAFPEILRQSPER